MRALLIDLDGVIYEGEQAVPGAAEALSWLGREQIPRLFLTNTSSRPRAALVEKLAGMGVTVARTEILTPVVVAAHWLESHAAGPVALFVPPATALEFGQLGIDSARGRPAAVVVGDYGERWTFAELNRAFRLLMAEPPPALVALGMTRYWRAPDGLRLDAGPFVAALSHATGIEPVVLGKPAKPFFDTALAALGATASDTLMIGDDIEADIGGAQRCGIRGLLVRTGKFRASDLEGKIRPHAIVDSIAGLPDWWHEAVGDGDA